MVQLRYVWVLLGHCLKHTHTHTHTRTRTHTHTRTTITALILYYCTGQESNFFVDKKGREALYSFLIKEQLEWCKQLIFSVCVATVNDTVKMLTLDKLISPKHSFFCKRKQTKYTIIYYYSNKPQLQELVVEQALARNQLVPKPALVPLFKLR